MTLDLNGTQHLFWAAITYPTGVKDYLDQSDAETRARFEATFAESPGFTKNERLGVYASAYFFRLLDVLKEMFPVLYWRVGADAFHNLVVDYLLAHPSRNENLRHLGDALPEFIAAHATCKLAPPAADIARVELSISRALDAGDGVPLTHNALGSIAPADWASLRISFTPSIALLELRFDYQALRTAALAGASAGTEADPIAETHLLVWRKQFRVFTRNIHETEATFLRALLAGCTFGEATEQLAQLGAPATQVVSYLDRWLQDELLCGASSERCRP